MSDDDLFKVSNWIRSFCQEKLLGGRVKLDVPLMTIDDWIIHGHPVTVSLLTCTVLQSCVAVGEKSRVNSVID